jgi:predicted dehydrogenase
VREVHVWNDRGNHPLDDAVVDPPATFNYDLWLGPVPPRPFKRGIHPYNWRRWWAFGSGLLGDIACHLMDVAFWALELKHPTKVSAEGSPQSDEYCADWVVARYEFPQRSADLPAVTLTWYDPPKQPPMLSSWKKAGLEEKLAGEGVMFVGERGMIFCNYTERRLLPVEQFKEFKAPTTRIAHSIGHQREWIEACLANDPTAVGAPFAYGALLTETALLGVVAFRCGKELQWDAGTMTVPNAPDAERFLAYDYRPGWKL